jgi:hypothetical protein
MYKKVMLGLITFALANSTVFSNPYDANYYRYGPTDFIHALATETFPSQADQPRRITSWNAYSIQFIDPPVFKLLPLPGTRIYQALIKQGEKIWKVESALPRLDLSGVWARIPVKTFTLTLRWLDDQGNVIAEETSQRIKAPDWAGLKEPPADWVAAADRNIAYLIHIADSGRAPYREPGVPVWIWSAASPCPVPTRGSLGPGYDNPVYREYFAYRARLWPEGHGESYPGCIIPAIIYGMLAHAQADRPQSENAMKLARIAGDWVLANNLPDSGCLPRFPFSTISNGKFYGGIEAHNVTLLRGSWIGLSLVKLYEATHEKKYLDYAAHIARVTAKFQAPDGSFPYRIDPRDGKVTEAFCTGGIQFSLLVDALAKNDAVDPDLLMASERTIQWMIAYPAQTNNWQGGYEDIGENRPYRNLTPWEAQLLIWYLCSHTESDPTYLPLAKKLLRFVEDQFVLFGPESEAHPVPVKGPLVFEQYNCWWPMEGHTGYYIRSLLALHQVTGDKEYLDKAQAAANAICAQQFEDGSISNWGTRWLENGKPKGGSCGHNWYNTNAIATTYLYVLDGYLAQRKPGNVRK